MPNRPANPCRRKGCPALVRSGGGYCPEHQSIQAARYDLEKRPERNNFYNLQKWRKGSKAFITLNPTCMVCQKQLATQTDHIVPLEDAPHLAFETTNWQSICQGCHSGKTARENKAKQRW